MVARNLAEIIPAIFTGPNGERLTPEQIARRQEVAQSLLAQATDTSPNAGGWTSVLAKGAMGFASGWKEKQAERGAAANAKASSADTAALLDVLGGGMSAPVAAPSPMGMSGPASVPPATNMFSTPMAANQPPIPGLQASGEGGEAYIRQGLVQRGLPEHVADAFVVNFKDESGLNPGINEQNPIVPGSRGGYGLYQLTGPRRVAYEQFAQERGVTPDNIDAQLDFLMMEGQGPERKAFESILSAPDTSTAAQAIVKNFLRPSPEYRDSRMAKYASLPSSGGGGYTDPMVSTPNAPRVEVAQALMPQAGPQTMTDAAPQAGGINPAVARVLSDPYADPRNVQLAQTLLTQQQAQAQAAQERALAEQQRAAEIQRRQQVAQQTGIDPAYAVDDELWKGATGNVFAAPSTSTVGTTVVDNRTGKPIFTGPEQMPTSVQEYNFYANQAASAGQTPLPYNEWSLQKASASAPSNIGSIPPGMELVRDGNSSRLVAIPGGPADMDAARTAAANDRAGGQREVASSVVTNAATRAMEAMKAEGLPASGVLGAAMSYLPESNAAEVRRQVDVLKANAKVENLQAMRQSSPTGGALGAVSDSESAMLAAKSGALDPNSPNFERDLKDYTRTMLEIIHGPDAGRELFNSQFGGGSDAPAPAQDGWTVVDGVKIRTKGGN